MPAQTPEQCDELLGQYLGEGNLDACLTLYEPQASVVQQDGKAHRGQPRFANSSRHSPPPARNSQQISLMLLRRATTSRSSTTIGAQNSLGATAAREL